MHPLIGRTLSKLNGAGNAILVLDARDLGSSPVDAAAARAINRRHDLAYDQLMVLTAPRSQDTVAYCTIFNNDGSEAGACGNGTRCVAFVLARAGAPARLVIETAAGRLVCKRLAADRYAVDLGTPRLRWDEIPLAEPFADTRGIELQVGPIDAPVLHTPAACSMGNPHVVFFVADPAAYDLPRVGPLIENHPLFPERVNVSLAAVDAADRIRLRVWERGAGLTQACGTAACATLVSAARRGLTGRNATVSLPGGDLHVAWGADDHVVLSGPVEWERDVVVDAALLE